MPMNLSRRTLTFFALLSCATVQASSVSWSRQVGPEAGLQFGVPAPDTNMCAYGDYQRSIKSSFGGNCPALIKLVDDYLTHWASAFPTLIPGSDAQAYFVPVTYDGTVYNAVTSYSNSSNPDYGFNIASTDLQNYLFNYYVPQILLPNGPNAKNNLPSDPSHPTYISMDGYCTNYTFYGVDINGKFTSNVTWNAGYPQSSAQWLQAWQAFFAFAKSNAPTIRLSPHVGSMYDPTWASFQSLYADTPAMERETFRISSLVSLGAYARLQFYNQLLNMYWFANVATPVFSTSVNPNEPTSRVLQWGTWLDNGDIHTALATYSMVRGPNTFFDLLTPASPQYAVNPTLWLPVANALGAGTSGPTVILVGTGYTANSGYVLLQRTWEHGISYLNLTGATQVINLAPGSKDWNGNSISTLTLQNGTGDVVLM